MAFLRNGGRFFFAEHMEARKPTPAPFGCSEHVSKVGTNKWSHPCRVNERQKSSKGSPRACGIWTSGETTFPQREQFSWSGVLGESDGYFNGEEGSY